MTYPYGVICVRCPMFVLKSGKCWTHFKLPPLSEVERRWPEREAGYLRPACLLSNRGPCFVQLLLEHFSDVFHHFSEARSRRF